MAFERQPVESDGRWLGEHIHRYNEAIDLIEPNDTVLDLACGTGFGSDMIAQKIKGKVVGGDIAADAIDECRQQWKKENLEFRVVDGTKLDYPDGYFDKIVSFETIEHTGLYKEMIKEFSRVLKPGGLLILSTPNRQVSSPDGYIQNPFHVQELTYDELKVSLESNFSQVEIRGQHNTRYDKRTFRKRIGKMFEKMFLSIGIGKLPYKFRNGFMKTFFGYPLYPLSTDFILETNIDRIKTKCPVQFAVCRK